ncbi:MAG: cell division ATP-binding protein FtsE [Oscillospiraceae bacterium]|nr:cell division ATP-binding protein FtsE [Oscillospiraceae bacterium]
MIEFANVSKNYKNGSHALKNVSFKIDKGEFVFIVGSSGAGKSTIIKTILREEVPSAGMAMVNGYNLNRMKRRHIPKYRRSLGVVFQDFRLIPNLNVYDNVAFALRVTNVVARDIRSRVPYVLKLLDLAHKAKSMPDQISGGEQQRVALARALVNNPSIIIADEPTGNIDPELSFEIIDLLSEINSQAGTTILMVTHEHELVSYFNKRVITIENGELISDNRGDESELFTGKELMEDYGRGLVSKEKAIDFSSKTPRALIEEYERQRRVAGGRK